MNSLTLFAKAGQIFQILFSYLLFLGEVAWNVRKTNQCLANERFRPLKQLKWFQAPDSIVRIKKQSIRTMLIAIHQPSAKTWIVIFFHDIF